MIGDSTCLYGSVASNLSRVDYHCGPYGLMDSFFRLRKDVMLKVKASRRKPGDRAWTARA